MATTAAVRRAFDDLTGQQIVRRNSAFNDGWRISDYWCGTYVLSLKGKDVARVVKGPRGGLSITML